MLLAAAAVVAVLDLDDQRHRRRRRRPGGPAGAVGCPTSRRGDLRRCCCPRVGVAIVGLLRQRPDRPRVRDPQPRRRSTATRSSSRSARPTSAPGVMQGFPVSSSGSRTVIGDSLGSRTPAVLPRRRSSRVVADAAVPRPAPRRLPDRRARRARRLRRAPAGRRRRVPADRRASGAASSFLALATTAGGAGPRRPVRHRSSPIGLSVLDLLRRVARPHDGILGYVPGRRRHARHRRLPGRAAGARAGRLPLRLAAVLRQRRGLQARGPWPSVDERRTPPSSGSCSTPRPTSRSTSPRSTRSRSCAASSTDRGIVFAMARVKQDLRDDLARRRASSTGSARTASS